MGEAARRLSRPRAAARVADEIDALVNNKAKKKPKKPVERMPVGEQPLYPDNTGGRP
jgi:hypothetical protein